jgi:hypothetical protein
LAVVDTTRLVSKVVVAVGGTATISFPASRNLPPVTWFFGGNSIANGGRYANAATAALQIKNLITSDTGGYVFETGDYTNSPVIKLQVVTGKPNYAGQSGSLPTGIVGASYSQSLPLPADVLLTPNSFRSTSLPRGLSIHRKTGLILGTPTTASADQVLGDEITFSVGNEFGTIPFKIRLLIKPLPPGVEGSFGGNVYIGSQLGGSTGGRMTITVGSSGAYSGQAVIGTETLPVRGIVRTNTPNDSTASGSIVLKPKHLSQALNLPFTINTASDLDDATANLTDSSSFSLWRNRWAIPGQTDPFAGYHTFALSETIGSNAPKGRGFGSVTIDSNGNTSAKGKLADGSSFTTASYLSPEGGILVYQTLYATAIKGSFIAILDLDEGSPAFFSSKTISNWFRPADPRSATIARAYPSGFGPELLGATGGLYQPPAETVIPMELGLPSGTPPSNAQLIFEQTLGNDPLPVDADVSLNIRAGGDSAVNLPNPKAVTFKLNPADGRFSGKYRTKDADPRPPASRPAISRSVDYAGIIIRDGSVLRGIGYLQRPDLPKADGSTTPSTSPIHSGPVALVPAP